MRSTLFQGISLRGIHGHSWKTFFVDLYNEINDDNLMNGAAALAYYLLLAIFPAMIFLLSLLPYLPIPNLQGEIMGLIDQFMPGDAAKMFTGTIRDIVGQERQSLLSIGALLTLWAASSGMYATMQALNITYDIKESRSFLKVRSTAMGLTVGFGALILSAFLMIVLGEAVQNWLAENLAWTKPLLFLFSAVRWIVIAAAILMAFSLTYYFGPDAKQKFLFVTPGSLLGLLLMVIASLAFKAYAEQFGNYNKTYGSIGAVIVLMLWLNILGFVILLGSEINALVEHYTPEGKDKGEKVPDQPTTAEAMHGKSAPLPEKKSSEMIVKTSSQSLKEDPMAVEVKFPPDQMQTPSYGAVIGEIGGAVKDIVQSEAALMKSEIKEVAPKFGRLSAELIGFGVLLFFSVFPVIAFLVIGLGRLLDDNYWLSSLLVGLVMGGTGAFLGYRAYKNLTAEDWSLPRTQESFRRVTDTLFNKVKDVQDATKRRAV